MFFLSFSHRFLFILCLVTIPVLVQAQAVSSLKHMSFLAASPNRNNHLINPPQYPVTRFCDSSDVCFKYSKTNMQPFKVIQMKKANEFVVLWRGVSELLIEHLQLTKDGTQLTENRMPIHRDSGVVFAHLSYVNDQPMFWVSHADKNLEFSLDAIDLETGKLVSDARSLIEATYLTGRLGVTINDIWHTVIRQKNGSLNFHYAKYGVADPVQLNWEMPADFLPGWVNFTLLLSDERIAVLLPNRPPDKNLKANGFAVFDKKDRQWSFIQWVSQPLIVRRINNFLVLVSTQDNEWSLNGKALLFNLADQSKIQIDYDELDSEVVGIKGNVIISRVGKVIKTSTLSEPNTFKTLSAKEDYSQVHWAVDLSLAE